MKTFTSTWSTPDIDNVEDSITGEWANALQQEIDNEIMVNVHKMQGWTIVNLSHLKNMMHAVDVEDWCVENAGPGMWNKFGSTFLFKDSKHAEWFMLRWL